MDAQRWQEIETLFHRALLLPATERAEFLATLRSEDPGLAAHLEPMLVADTSSSAQIGGILNTAISDALDQLPATIGPYEIVSRIGVGGFCSVFLARPQDGSTQPVAIKVLRRGLGSPEIQRRLWQESEILARLHHANIARLLDHGSSDLGEPYFVMEFIDGEPIDRFCDRHRLTIAQRLELFRSVCSAVDYAHRNLVIHRDIKPNNLLVTKDGIPKLLDFGIAKLLNPGVIRGEPVETATGASLMTPDFASPEQVSEEPLTTATDVYSLGVLLYRLLSGRPPYRFSSRAPRVIDETVSTIEPPTPSSAATYPGATGEPSVADIASCRQAAPRQLRGRLQGDLDSIVLMALEKRPEERYASVVELSRDIARHLRSEPVTARRITQWYRARRFVRRHRVAVGLAAVILGAIAAAIVVTTRATLRADVERNRAERLLVEARQVTGFLVDIFEVPDPEKALGREFSARELLDRGTQQIADQLQHQPQVRASLMATMGKVYGNLGDHRRSRDLLEESLDLRRQLLPAADPAIIEGSQELARMLMVQGEYEPAGVLLRDTRSILSAAGRAGTAEDARALNLLANVQRQLNRLDDAADLGRQALQIQHRLLQEDNPDLIESLAGLGQLKVMTRDFEGAEEIMRDVLRRRRSRFGDSSPYVATDLGNLVVALHSQGRFEEAEISVREVIDIRANLYGDDHWIVTRSYENLAQILSSQGRVDEALPPMEAALAIARSHFGPDHPRVPGIMVNLARAYKQTGRLQDAEALYLDALDSHQRIVGENHPSTARNLQLLATLYADQRRDDEALALFDRVISSLQASLPEGDYRLSYPLYLRGKILARRGDCRLAVPALEHASSIRQMKHPAGHDSLLAINAELTRCGVTPSPMGRLTTPHKDRQPRALPGH